MDFPPIHLFFSTNIFCLSTIKTIFIIYSYCIILQPIYINIYLLMISVLLMNYKLFYVSMNYNISPPQVCLSEGTGWFLGGMNEKLQECMPRRYTPSRVSQDVKVIPAAQQKQAGTYGVSSSIESCWRWMTTLIIIAKTLFHIVRQTQC